MANAPVGKQGGEGVHILIVCVICITEMLVSKQLVHQDFRRLQMHEQEEECREAALIAVNNYNKALVQ